jgi:hypothetical protein
MEGKHKSKGKPRQRKWGCIIVNTLLTMVILVVSFFSLIILALWILVPNIDITIPPQDCVFSTVTVRGNVFDMESNPIPNATIRAWNDGSHGLPAFDFTVQSDTFGSFVTESAGSYACTPFQVEVSADGYETVMLEYYPMGEDFPGELPYVITVQMVAISE